MKTQIIVCWFFLCLALTSVLQVSASTDATGQVTVTFQQTVAWFFTVIPWEYIAAVVVIVIVVAMVAFIIFLAKRRKSVAMKASKPS